MFVGGDAEIFGGLCVHNMKTGATKGETQMLDTQERSRYYLILCHEFEILIMENELITMIIEDNC